MSKYYTDRYGRLKQKTYIIEITIMVIAIWVLFDKFMQCVHPERYEPKSKYDAVIDVNVNVNPLEHYFKGYHELKHSGTIFEG